MASKDPDLFEKPLSVGWFEPLVHSRHGGVAVSQAIHVPNGKPRLRQTEANRVFREPSLRVLDPEKPLFLFGHSMGGAIAAEMAWQQPKRIDRLALLSPAGFGLVPDRIRALRHVPDGLAPLAHLFASRAAARFVLGDVYGPDGSWTARDEEELLAPYSQRDIYRALLRTVKEFDFRVHSDALLTRLPSGTLVVFGTHDAVVRPYNVAARVRLVPGGQLVMLPRVGHLPQVEAKDDVHYLLVKFLSGEIVAGADGGH